MEKRMKKKWKKRQKKTAISCRVWIRFNSWLQVIHKLRECRDLHGRANYLMMSAMMTIMLMMIILIHVKLKNIVPIRTITIL